MALKLNQINKRKKAQRRNESSRVPAKTRTMLPWEIPTASSEAPTTSNEGCGELSMEEEKNTCDKKI
jgi:hypothetical protein